MAEDKKPSTSNNNSNRKEKVVNDGITPMGKFFAGILLISVTFLVVIAVIAFWPDKMPAIKDGDNAAWYTCKLFHISLIEDCEPAKCEKKDSLIRLIASYNQQKVILQKLADTTQKNKAAVELLKLDDSIKSVQTVLLTLDKGDKEVDCKIHLNTILLILVALMGFLGNMIHVASSFTSYVGNETFKKTWILWYFVKPFTASGLAIVIYFIIRAGFLSYNTGAGGVSLYGILSFAALAGLFTDSATLKLKEIFEVIFKPKDERKDKLDGDEFSVTRIFPETIPSAGESTLALSGKNLDKADVKITIDDIVITPASKTALLLTIKYTPTQAAIDAGKAVLLIADGTGKALYTKDIKISK